MQLEAHQQKKTNQSNKGKSDKTKCSENYQVTENDGLSSLGEVTESSENDERHSITRYRYNPSIMKRRIHRAEELSHLDHPSLNQRMAHNEFKRTDLAKIKNVMKQGNGIKNAKFFNLGTKNFF